MAWLRLDGPLKHYFLPRWWIGESRPVAGQHARPCAHCGKPTSPISLYVTAVGHVCRACCSLVPLFKD